MRTSSTAQRDERKADRETWQCRMTADRDWGAALPRSSATSAPRTRRPSARAINAACRSSISSPIRATRAATFRTTELDELAASIKERGIIQPVVVRAVRGATRCLRDHRRRAALAGGATRGPARDSDRAARSDRQRGARACHHRERAAHRSQSAGRGRRLSGAGERVQAQSRGHRQDRRQEPQPRHQHAAPVEAAGAGQGLYQCRQDHRRRRAHADRGARSGSDGARDRRSRAQRAPGRGAGEGARERTGQGGQEARASKNADTVALERRVSDALGLTVTIDHRSKGGVLQRSATAASISSTTCCGGWRRIDVARVAGRRRRPEVTRSLASSAAHSPRATAARAARSLGQSRTAGALRARLGELRHRALEPRRASRCAAPPRPRPCG